MAGRKKDDNAAGFVLILICVILWGIYVAVRALINLNERFIDAVSNPALRDPLIISPKRNHV